MPAIGHRILVCDIEEPGCVPHDGMHGKLTGMSNGGRYSTIRLICLLMHTDAWFTIVGFYKLLHFKTIWHGPLLAIRVGKDSERMFVYRR